MKAPSKPLTALMGAAEVEYNNNNNNNIPSLVQFAEGWSVPVNISAHAGRVRASLSARPLHADTIRIAVCVPESRRLLSNTRAGESRTERRDWGRPAPSGHRALIAKLFFFLSSIFNRCNMPAAEKEGLRNRILQQIPLLILCGSPSIYIHLCTPPPPPTLFLATPSLFLSLLL